MTTSRPTATRPQRSFVDTRPCHTGPVGACLPNPACPHRCYRCDAVMTAARTHLAMQIRELETRLNLRRPWRRAPRQEA